MNNYEQYAPLLLDAGCTRMRELCSLNVAALRACGLPIAVAHFIFEECKKQPVGEKRAAAPSASPAPKRQATLATHASDFMAMRKNRLTKG